MEFIRPKKSLSSYLDQYETDHRTLGNRVLHMVGIPLVWMALPFAFASPLVAIFLLVAGLAIQSSAHTMFEASAEISTERKRFDIFYSLVGPIWVANAFDKLIGLR